MIDSVRCRRLPAETLGTVLLARASKVGKPDRTRTVRFSYVLQCFCVVSPCAGPDRFKMHVCMSVGTVSAQCLCSVGLSVGTLLLARVSGFPVGAQTGASKNAGIRGTRVAWACLCSRHVHVQLLLAIGGVI